MNARNLLSRRLFPIVSALLFSAASSSRADEMYIWAEEVGGNVVFYHKGSFDLAGFPVPTTDTSASSINPSSGRYFAIDSTSTIYAGVLPNPMTRTFGTGGATSASSFSGDILVISSTATLGLPLGYVSKTPLSGSITFLGATFGSLGIVATPFSYNTVVGANTVHMFTDPADVAAAAAVAAARADLLRKIKRLKKKARKAKKKGQLAKANKLKRKIKKLKRRLRKLG